MSISAAQVKTLRDRTGAGMMECKKALVEAEGDLDQAVEIMRKAGLAKADKKAGRTAAEGRIVLAEDLNTAVLVEVNCETDFVGGGDAFGEFAQSVAEAALTSGAESVESLAEVSLPGGKTVEQARRELIAKLGENVALRRVGRVARQGDRIGHYLHGTRIGVVVDISGGDDTLARDLAMHIAASRPVCVLPEDMPEDKVVHERAIFQAQAEESGKPAEIVAKMVEGRVRKFLNEAALVGQPFVKDPDMSVGKLLQSKQAQVLAFQRFEVGEGIEKEDANFAAEVMAQVKGN